METFKEDLGVKMRRIDADWTGKFVGNGLLCLREMQMFNTKIGRGRD